MKTLFALFFTLVVFSPLVLRAQAPATSFDGPAVFKDIGGQLGAASTGSGLAAANPQGGLREYVAKIIKGVLGLLATIALVLIIYAGFLWMTSGGNEEQVTKAQTLLKNAFIGLLIVILSYSITIFVFRSLLSQQR